MAFTAGLAGATMATSGCLIQDRTIGETGWIPEHYKGVGAFPVQAKGRIAVNPVDPAIARNDRLCILCAQCIEVCRRQSVFDYHDLPLKGDFVCVHCGQCTLWCPSFAITEKYRIEEVKAVLDDPDKFVIVQTAPATRIGLGEEFGLPIGSWVQDRQVAALRALGFDRTFDTNFTADLTIMEEGTELIKRLNGELPHALPQITSCCPGWIKFAEYFYPDLLDHLSTAKSPQQMFGTLAKTYYAEMSGIDPEKIVTVSIMPCTAKKFEAAREMVNDAKNYWKKEHIKDMDYVLTTRELALLLKEKRIDINDLPDENYDSIMSEGSGAGVLFGATGGVMQAAVRSAYFLISGQNCPPEVLELKSLHGLDEIKEASVPIPGFGTVNVAVVQGLRNARIIMEAIRRGEKVPYHFIEVMACRGGCATGGGQPRATVPPSDAVRAKRIEAILRRDAELTLRESHENPEILKLYETFLGLPHSDKAYQLLHTKYSSRGHLLNAKRLG
ncbi:MAG: [FeFe] hydrogenase, group A [Deltaproteobacteria bacterium]|nr:[FeFe] hydrogenase, group A [Deltaproteobacteria bacterium]